MTAMKNVTTRSSFRLPAAIAAAVLAGVHAFAMEPGDLAARIARNEPILIIDVRPSVNYQDGHIPGAINIPLALLPHKPVPRSDRALVYGDGLGLVDDEAALEIVRAKGVSAELLEGGFAAWLATTRLSTGAAGLLRERLPGITYQQLVDANKRDVVLVDLRGQAPKPAAAEKVDPETGRTIAAAVAPDLLEDFAGTLGVPVMKPARTARMSASAEELAKDAGTGAASIAAQVGGDGKSRKLLVLVADSEADASEAARHLRASGYYRFTILVGGMESVRHEGRTGLSRQTIGAPVVPVEP
jgi:rhodanese-related sulfurtransferase